MNTMLTFQAFRIRTGELNVHVGSCIKSFEESLVEQEAYMEYKIFINNLRPFFRSLP